MAMENATVAGWKLAYPPRSKLIDYPGRYWAKSSSRFDSTANVRLVKLGSGGDIYASILPALEQAEEEVILVTCFWARSETLTQLNKSLRRLSKRAQNERRTVKVRICFSSVSLWQKLTHTRSMKGREYLASEWQHTLGLPSQQELSGLDITIKSLFILPFSVFHPKFIIIDRQQVFLPSCNVSWENWFEGCVELMGPITDQFVQFYEAYWASPSIQHSRSPSPAQNVDIKSRALFLPSPHHSLWLYDGISAPALSLFDGISAPASPQTPLNCFILSALREATRTIYIQTPNLTSRAVLNEILATLKNSVDIRIVTSQRLMIPEQLVTARTTTARCVNWLGKKHQKLQHDRAQQMSTEREALLPPLGKLEILYYTPRPHTSDPVQSHIKVMIADEEIIVLGSGNLDRASWVTSQELGVAVIDKNFAQDFKHQLNTALEGRLRSVYPPP